MARIATVFREDAILLADLVAAPLAVRFVTDEIIDVTDSAMGFDYERFVNSEVAFAQSLPFNEATLAPFAIRCSENVTTVDVHASTYSAYRAAREQYSELALDERLRMAMDGIPATYLHTFGVNCTVETRDGRMVLVRRSAINESTVGQLSISVSENSNTGDVRGGVFDPSVTLLRGLEEELGLLPVDLAEAPLFHSLVAQVPDGQISLAAHVRTTLTASDVLARQLLASDAAEAGGIVTVPFNPETIERLIEEHDAWVPWALPALAGALRVRFGAAATGVA